MLEMRAYTHVVEQQLRCLIRVLTVDTLVVVFSSIANTAVTLGTVQVGHSCKHGRGADRNFCC